MAWLFRARLCFTEFALEDLPGFGSLRRQALHASPHVLAVAMDILPSGRLQPFFPLLVSKDMLQWYGPGRTRHLRCRILHYRCLPELRALGGKRFLFLSTECCCHADDEVDHE